MDQSTFRNLGRLQGGCSDGGEGHGVGVNDRSHGDAGMYSSCSFLLRLLLSLCSSPCSLNTESFKRLTSASFTGFKRKSSAPSSKHLLSVHKYDISRNEKAYLLHITIVKA